MNRVSNKSSYKLRRDFFNPHLIKLIMGQTSQQVGRPVCFPVDVFETTIPKQGPGTMDTSDSIIHIRSRVAIRVSDKGNNTRTIAFKMNILEPAVFGQVNCIV
jgi:hypothetical protein